MHVVYVDQVLAGNLLLNYVLLRTAGRLGQVAAARGRLLLAAALGSIYSLLWFMPGFHQLFTLPVKVVFSLATILVAFGPLPARRFLACYCFFFLASFALGGMWLGFVYFLSATPGYSHGADHPFTVIDLYYWPGLFLALLALLGGGRAMAWLVRTRLHRGCLRVPLVVELNGRRVEARALVDTGNSLRDPLTGHPVVVMEYNALKEALPAGVRELFEQEGGLDSSDLLAALSATSLAPRFRLIPFRSLGRERGLLVGIRPDRVEVKDHNHRKAYNRVVVGIYRRPLDHHGGYQALIPPDLMSA